MPPELALTTRTLTAVEFEHLAAVPPELEWFANIRNARTRRAYHNDVTDFCRFVGISAPEDGGVSHVLGLSEGLSKLIAIDKQPNHQIVHLFGLGKTNRTAH